MDKRFNGSTGSAAIGLHKLLQNETVDASENEASQNGIAL
jgi:hypothetical protein